MATVPPLTISAGQIRQLQSVDTLNVDTPAVFNESGADQDFRIESNNLPFMFMVDAGDDAVKIGGSAAGSVADFRNDTVVFNEFGVEKDFRIEGDTLPYVFFVNAADANENIALLATAEPNWQSMDRGIFIGNCSTAPTGNPTNGVFLYAESGELIARDSSGNVVTLTSTGSGGVDVSDEGVATVSGATTLDFVGSGVVVTDAGGGTATITITGGGLADGDYGDVTVSGSGTIITIDSQNLQDIIALTDPGADRILFWDDSEGEIAYLTVGTGLSISGDTLSASGGSIGGSTGSTDEALIRADGTGGSTVQSSTVTLSDSGTLTGVAAINASSSLVINSTGANVDFRIAGDNRANLFFIDASADAVQIGDAIIGNIADFRSTGVVLNETGGDKDFRVEGDSISHAIFLDATSTTENIALVATAAPNWQSMDRGLFIGNAETAPTGNPSNGVFLYASGGELLTRNTSGDVKTLSPLPHYCELSGSDTTGQSLTHNTTDDVDLTISVSDAFGMGDLTANTITIQRTGIYLVAWGAAVSSSSPSGALTRLFVGVSVDPGTGFNGLRAAAAPFASGITYSFNTALVPLNAGDVVKMTIQVQTDDGSGRTVGTVPVQRSRLSVMEIR